MAEIIAFRPRAPEVTDSEIDLLTAVDAAIRDLRDISRACAEESVRERADECREMLEKALRENVI